mgnify:CR=1 FL=1
MHDELRKLAHVGVHGRSGAAHQQKARSADGDVADHVPSGGREAASLEHAARGGRQEIRGGAVGGSREPLLEADATVGAIGGAGATHRGVQVDGRTARPVDALAAIDARRRVVHDGPWGGRGGGRRRRRTRERARGRGGRRDGRGTGHGGFSLECPPFAPSRAQLRRRRVSKTR